MKVFIWSVLWNGQVLGTPNSRAERMFLVGFSLTRSFVCGDFCWCPFSVDIVIVCNSGIYQKMIRNPTVDGSEILHQSICGLSHYLQGSLHPSWRSPDLSWNFHFWGPCKPGRIGIGVPQRSSLHWHRRREVSVMAFRVGEWYVEKCNLWPLCGGLLLLLLLLLWLLLLSLVLLLSLFLFLW